MGRVHDGIDDHLDAWIARQPLFFVATAPLSADGHVNVSPKGPIGSLRVLEAFEGTRPHYDAYCAKKLRVHGPGVFEADRTGANAESLDGLPALRP